MKRAEVSSGRLARELGFLSDRSVRRWVSGQTGPDRARADSLARILGDEGLARMWTGPHEDQPSPPAANSGRVRASAEHQALRTDEVEGRRATPSAGAAAAGLVPGEQVEPLPIDEDDALPTRPLADDLKSAEAPHGRVDQPSEHSSAASPSVEASHSASPEARRFGRQLRQSRRTKMRLLAAVLAVVLLAAVLMAGRVADRAGSAVPHAPRERGRPAARPPPSRPE